MDTDEQDIERILKAKELLELPKSVMWVLSMWLMKKSRKVTSVNTNMKHEHVSLPETQ